MGQRSARVKLEDIHLDVDWFQFKKPEANGSKAARQIGLSEQLIEDLVVTIETKTANKSRTLLDPLVLWRNEAGTYWLVDGHHRYEAYQRAGVRKAIAVHIHEAMDRHTARRLAWDLNRKSHRNPSREERFNAAWEFIRNDDPHYRELSPRKFSGVFDGIPSRSTVERMREMREALKADGLLEDPRYAIWQRAQGYTKEGEHEPYDMETANTKRIGELSVRIAALLKERDRRNDWYTLREAFAEAIETKFGIEAGVTIHVDPDDDLEEDF